MVLTKIIKIDPINPDEKYLKEAAEVLQKGGLVILPTETVYGIAANMLHKEAINRLCEIKQRPKDKPFSLLIAYKGDIEAYASEIPISAYKLIDAFWPGPLTLILKCKEGLCFDGSRTACGEPSRTTCGEPCRTIGMRMPDNEIALKIISWAQVPLACPSANLSGKPAPVNFEPALQDLKGLVDMALDSGATKLGIESTVVDLTQGPFRMVRAGAIKKDTIEEEIQKKHVLFVCTGNSCRSVMAQALLKKRLKEKNRRDVEVLSAGIMMLSGLGATEATKAVLQKEGIDVSTHRSQEITQEMVKKSDIILVMERLHEERLLQIAPEVKNRVFLLKEFAKINNNFPDIPDPIGKPLEFYEETFAIIKQAVEKVAEIL